MSFLKQFFADEQAASTLREMQARVEALDKSQAVIEFDLNGTILNANQNFLNAMGYRLDEIQGQHHSMFVTAEYRNSEEYRQFWETLRRGQFQQAEYPRVAKGGREIWIQASYNPVMDENGQPCKVVKYATDITEQKRQAAEYEATMTEMNAKIDALDKSQATIEFHPDGTIITANDNFLGAVGYRLDEIQGQHHRMFVEPDYGNSSEYREFWRLLAAGDYQADEYQRFGKGGNEIWIQASYNPVKDAGGKVYKVVKYATDITAQKNAARIAEKNANIANALKLCQANVMLADNDMNIVYMNDTLEAMLQHRESELRGELPSFRVSELIGINVDTFHKKPSHQRNMIGGLTEAYKTQLKVADLTFSLTASPWMDTEGRRIGTVVEWVDMTAQLKAEEAAQQAADESMRIKQALDVCQANVMMADADCNIIYTNNSVNDMLRVAQSDIQTELPNFVADRVLGSNIDVFHKNPSHQRNMLANMTDVYRTQLKVGGRVFNLVATPVMDKGNRLGTVVEWVDMTEELKRQEAERTLANANARVKNALDVVNTNAMIADKDCNIVYMNEAVQNMMSNAEADLRKDIAGFDASALVGANIDIFHKNPAHQRGMVESLKSTFKTEIVVGGRTFGLIANPIFNDEKERIGTIVEWNDRTLEVATEKEIDAIVEAASNGDLSRRLELQGKEGFFRTLGEGLNRLLTISDSVVSDTIRVFDALAHGNLTRSIDADYQGAFDKLKHDANTTVERLTDIITRIRESASTVSTGASEIAQGNADLSRRTESQASSLEETASSMEEMTSAVKQTSDNSVHANELAAAAKSKAQTGGDVVSKAVGAMDEINNASKKIADIIGVIDEIAFQTNLLALNAAVEAARAGEQGRGFAVVAGEVRNLAQRSAGAAKEIKDLIRDSVDKVDAGTSLVNESGRTLTEIIEAVDRVSEMIREISTAAKEQSSGIEQVNSAVSQMDEMTQQNAALVEEASAAGEAMAEQSRSMMEMMEFFTLDANRQGSPMIPQAAAMPAAAPAQAAAVTPVSDSSGGVSVSDDEDWAEF